MQFTQRQQQTIAAALTMLSAVAIAAILLSGFWVLAAFLHRFSHVLLPLVVAAIAALICQPYFQWLVRRGGLPRTLAVIALIFTIVLPVAAFVGFFGVVVAHQLRDLISQLPQWWSGLMTEVEQRLPEITSFFENDPIGKRIREQLEGHDELVAAGIRSMIGATTAAGTGVLHWISAVFSWAITPVYFVFFLLARPQIQGPWEKYLPFLKEETRDDVIFLVEQFVTIIVAFFRGQLVIALLQGILYALGFHLVGLKYGLILGLALGVLNIIPYLGSIVGLAVTLPLAFFQAGGGWVTLAWVIAVFSAVQLIEGYLLTPKIMGDRTGLHPVVIIVAIFFWGSALAGVLGMLLAIPLTAFLVVFWRLAREKYIAELI